MLEQRPVPDHTVKADPDVFQAVVDGKKLGELRRDDRYPRYSVGQVIELVEYDRERQIHSGRWQLVRIIHVSRGEHIPPEFVLWSHELIGDAMPNEPCHACKGDGFQVLKDVHGEPVRRFRCSKCGGTGKR